MSGSAPEDSDATTVASTPPAKGAEPVVQKEDWRVRLGVPLGIALLGLLSATWRTRAHNMAVIEPYKDGKKGLILGLWHGQLLALAWYMRRRGIVVLVSASRDGEIITRVIESWGYRTVRGSSTRGGREALVALLKELRGGSTVAITPDGPRGPARKYQAGALVAAQRTGVPIIPYALHVDRAWRLKGWDRFTIPKPFAKITFVFGEPMFVSGDSSAGAVEQAPVFEAALDATVRAADEAAARA
jgi:lysophospholipid acyltransferase (LPLAT)-like uncharacterized protein